MNTMLLNEVEANKVLDIELGTETATLRELCDAELLTVGGGAGDVVLG